MKHPTDELIGIAYGYYPRGVAYEDPRYRNTDEHRRLVAERKRAADQRGPWRALLKRLRAQFPGNEVHDRVAYCPAEFLHSAYSCVIDLPSVSGEHQHGITFLLSFLAPCYTVYAERFVFESELKPAGPSPPSDTTDIFIHDTCYVVPAHWVTPELGAAVEEHQRLGAIQNPLIADILAKIEEQPRTRREIGFDLSPDEQPYAAWLAREVEINFGYECTPPVVGKIIVPDVETGGPLFGEATLYDCLISDI